MTVLRSAGSMKILIEDSSPFHLNALQTLLRSFGLRHVVACPDAQTARAACAAYRPNMIFVDWAVDDIRQQANITGLRQIVPDSDIIVLASNPTPKCVETIRNAAVQGLIVKPFSGAIVRRYIERCRARRLDRQQAFPAGLDQVACYRRDVDAFAAP